MSQSRATQSPSISKTGCCIVGAGPAGAVLALLLAKAGVAVTLIEAHRDFDREILRGDTVHLSTLDLLAQLGLAEKTLALSHSRVSSVTLEIPGGGLFSPLNLEGLQLAFPFIAIIASATPGAPDPRSLALSKLPTAAQDGEELVIEEGQVRGVRYAQDRATTELRADVVIAADGRFSKVRKLADLLSRLPMAHRWTSCGSASHERAATAQAWWVATPRAGRWS